MISTAEGWTRILAHKYERFGIPTSFTSPVAAATVTIPLIDMTKGEETGDGFAHVATVLPMATARSSDLSALGISPGDMIGVCFDLNEAGWQIKSFVPKPGPFGQALGEINFMLEAV